MKVYDLANEIWIELESPADPALPFIATWLRQNIGDLNVSLGISISIDSNLEFSQELSNEEKSIFKKLYYVDYYKGMIAKSLSAGGYLGNGWISIKEGDSAVTRANPNEVAKTYRGLMNDAQKEVDGMIKLYKGNHNPLHVPGDDTQSEDYYQRRNYNPRINN